MNHYQVLGVGTGADPAEIRRAYLRLARAHHPDAHTGEGSAALASAERRMREVNEAWAVLRDPVRRRRYDDEVRQGTAGRRPPAPAGPDGPARPGWRPLASDTAWMDDFEAWKYDAEDFVPRDPPSATRSTLTVLPVALFAAAIAVGSIGLVLDARPVLAAAFVGVALSAALFVALPMIEMTRRRGRR